MDSRNRPLSEWLIRIRTGQIKLPRFQRFEAWPHANVTSVLNNVLRDLPIGALLILEVNADNEPFVSRTVVGAEKTGEQVNESHLVPYEEMVTGNYEDFLLARAKKMEAVLLRL